MIVGLGVDLCEAGRIAELEERYGRHFVERVFTADEEKWCRGRRRHECLAGRFAAKEAALKALGTGLSHGIGWHDVELTSGEYQKPRMSFHGHAREILERLGATNVQVSITHDGGRAVAVVILEGEQR